VRINVHSLYNAVVERDITAIPPLTSTERILYGHDKDQFFDVWRSSRARSVGTAVVIHGGFWRALYDLNHTSHLCAALAKSGVLTANLEYRRVGHSGGGWPRTFEDVVAGAMATAEYFGSAPLVLGHSAGGHLALRLASEQVRLRAVVALAPVADLRLAYDLNLSNGAVAEFLGGTPASRPDLYAAACPSRHAASVPRVLIHGTRDDTVPIAIAREFVKARERDAVLPKLIEVTDAGHFDLIDPESDAWPVVLHCVQQLLRQ
jgi:acetyl esterase/lipase